MKNATLILIAIVMVFSLSACAGGTSSSNVSSSTQQGNRPSKGSMQHNSQSNEENGVPQSQLAAEIYPSSTKYNYTVTECTHNVDTVLHQDIIVIRYSANFKYMRTDYVQSYVYQYNRETDIWTQIQIGDRNYNYTLLDNLRNTEWTGMTGTGMPELNVYYSVTVDAINTIDGWIKFSYDIEFGEKEYNGTRYLEYGEFTLTQVENMFRITFDPDDGFSVARV